MAIEPELLDPALLDALVARVRELQTRTSRRVLIGIAGAPGVGKTTVAQSLAQRLSGGPDRAGSTVAHVPMDGFHLADVELARLGRLGRKGAPDTVDVDGYAALLARIAAGEQVWAPAFERTLEQPIAQSLPVTAATQVVISEGNYLLLPDPAWQRVRAQFAQVWFVRTAHAERVEQLTARHVRFGKSPEQARAWVEAVDEPNAVLVDATVRYADLVVDL